jgi:large subunit ribosomal protein L31
MKDNIHPKYREVVIKDISSDFQLITRSTRDSKEKITIDGVEYPLIMVEVSSASHPYYTGKQILMDSAGRIDRFKSRYTEIVGAKRKTREEVKPVETEEKTLSKTKLKKLAAANAPAKAPKAEVVEAAVEATESVESAEG